MRRREHLPVTLAAHPEPAHLTPYARSLNVLTHFVLRQVSCFLDEEGLTLTFHFRYFVSVQHGVDYLMSGCELESNAIGSHGGKGWLLKAMLAAFDSPSLSIVRVHKARRQFIPHSLSNSIAGVASAGHKACMIFTKDANTHRRESWQRSLKNTHSKLSLLLFILIGQQSKNDGGLFDPLCSQIEFAFSTAYFGVKCVGEMQFLQCSVDPFVFVKIQLIQFLLT